MPTQTHQNVGKAATQGAGRLGGAGAAAASAARATATKRQATTEERLSKLQKNQSGVRAGPAASAAQTAVAAYNKSFGPSAPSAPPKRKLNTPQKSANRRGASRGEGGRRFSVKEQSKQLKLPNPTNETEYSPESAVKAIQQSDKKGAAAHAISDRKLAPVSYKTLMKLAKAAEEEGENFVAK